MFRGRVAGFLGAASVVAITAAMSGVAVAETAEAAADAAPGSQVGEIIVTATRRAERTIDVPVAVTAISGQKLDVLNSSGLDIRFLSGRTPSLVVESSFGRTFPRFYIRGLGNTDFDINSAQPVSVVYDDVALENPLLKSYPVFDLADVEVLRGPQGTLFGRNTPAGVVKIDSAKPSDTYGGYGSISWGTYNTVNAEGAVGGPLGGGFSARLSGMLQRRDGWVTNTDPVGKQDLEGYSDAAMRFQLAYKADDFDALLNLHGRVLHGTPRVFRAGIFQQGSNKFVPDFDVDKVALDGRLSQKVKSAGASLHLNYHLDGLGQLHSISSYEETNVTSDGDIDGGDNYVFPPLGLNNALFPVSTGGTSRPQEYSQELRFESEQFGKFRGQAGVYFFYSNLSYNELDFTTTGAIDGNVRHHDQSRNVGVFASGEYKATDALTVRAGLRYSDDHKKDLIFGDGILTGVTLPAQNKVNGSNLSGDISATYVVNPDMNVYARIATGYLGPAIQDRVNFFSVPTTAKQQTTTSGEAGIKTRLFDGRVRFDFDGYYFVTKDMQLTAVGGTFNSARLLNADKAIGAGLEMDIEAQPIDNLSLTLGASYNYTEIKDANISIAPCGSGVCTVNDPLNSDGNALIDGNRLPQAPRYVVNATARYAWPLASGDQIYVYTDWFYRSSINYFLYDASEFRGRYELQGGLRVGYQTQNGLEVAAFVRNITNQIRSESAIDFNNLTGMVNDPRTYGVALKKVF